MHRRSVPNRAANSRSRAIRSPSADPGYATQRRNERLEHLANLRYLEREVARYETLYNQIIISPFHIQISPFPPYFTLPKCQQPQGPPLASADNENVLARLRGK